MHLKPPPAQALFSHPRAKDWLAWLAAIILGLAAAIIPYLFNHRFYFNDDQQNGIYPYYYEIGRQLHACHQPYLTLATFNGGNFSIDWELTSFNPIALLCCWLFYFARDLTTAGLLLCGFYIVLTALAAYNFGRSFRFSRALSLVAAAVLSTNNYVMYFYADSWVPGLICQCWLLWTWGSLQRYRSSGSTTSLAFFVIFAYLTVTSGWPHGDLMLACLIIGYAVELVMANAGFARLKGLILATFSAFLLCLPTLLPVFLSFSWINRGGGFFSNGIFMSNLSDILNFSSFFHPHHLPVWNIASTYSVPLFFLAWFMWIFIPLFRWEAVKSTLTMRVALFVFTACALEMLFSSEQLGPIRWPIRFLPFVHAGFIIAFLIVLNHSESVIITPRRLLASAAVLLATYSCSIFNQPRLMDRQLFGLALSLIFAGLAIAMVRFRRPVWFSSILILGTFTGHTFTHFWFPNSPILPDFLSSPSVITAASRTIRPFDGYSLYLGGKPQRLDWNKDFFFAAQGIYQQQYTINGETSLGQRAFFQHFNADLWTEIRDPHGLSTLFSRETETGTSFIDLMRVNSLCIAGVDALKDSIIDYVLPLMANDWKLTRKTSSSSWFERIHPNLQHTTLSWSSPDIQVIYEAPPTGEKENIRVKAGHLGGFLVFTRLYWPGYQAELDGRPLAVTPLDGLLVKVVLPPDCQGRLSLTFVPPGLRLGYAGACLGILLFVISLAVARRSSRHEKVANQNRNFGSSTTVVPT
jgi:hypothetical protein